MNIARSIASPIARSIVGSGGGGRTIWTPPIPALVWLSAYDTATLFQNIAGTTPVTAHGQPIGYVADKSGNGNHFASTADTTVRPAYDLIGEKAGILFNASAVKSLRRAMDLSAVTELTICVAIERLNNATNRPIIDQNNASAPGFQVSYTTPATNLRAASGGSVMQLNTRTDLSGSAGGESHVIVSFHKISAPSLVSSEVNGVASTPTTTSQGTGGFQNGVVAIGSRVDSALTLSAKIRELLIFDSIVSGDNLTSIRTHLQSRL